VAQFSVWFIEKTLFIAPIALLVVGGAVGFTFSKTYEVLWAFLGGCIGLSIGFYLVGIISLLLGRVETPRH